MDIAISSVGLILLLPVFAVVALLIALDSHGSIFYYQPRLGKGGNKFRLIKFRTMHVDADNVLKNYLEKDPALKLEWDQYQKLKKDPRITRVGDWLRRFSIDELPQLWNVLIGEMSLVGPRPIMLGQAESYGSRLEHYQRVRPGISGMWQINGRNLTTFARRAELDYQYVLTWSFWLDIYILARTVWVVARREGAS
jgi:lipopolysaccharide/colanic/teichoic acid biosynthesis glycosyltransferase